MSEVTHARCTGVNVDEVFTTNASETPVSVASWGFLGDTWPFFRPNFVNMDKHREERRAEEVRICCSRG
jgi:DNA ligase 1